MTFEVFKYSVRGLYEADKLTFTLLLALKIDMQAQKVRPEEFSILIKGKCGKHCTKLSEYAEESLKRKSFWVKQELSLNGCHTVLDTCISLPMMHHASHI